jgi:hypothetical protein
MNEIPALESRRVRTQPLTVTEEPVAVWPVSAALMVIVDMFELMFQQETPNNKAPVASRTPPRVV